MAKFTDYTQKTKPADADLLLIHDNAGAANKKTPFSGVWSWILDKLASAVISQLETTNKSIIPAINELNSKTFQSSGKVIDADVDWNTITEVGVYKVQCHEHFKEDKNVPMINSISDFYNYGILLVFSPFVNDKEKRLIQIYIPDIMTSEPNRSRIAIRSFNTSFRNWGIVNVSNTL